MNSGLRFRLVAVALAIGLLGAMIFFVTQYSQRQVAELRTRLNELDSERLGIAEQFKDTLREVSDRLSRYRVDRDDASWKDFLEASGRLNLWIEAEKPRLNTEREKEVLRQIDAAYDDYLRNARQLHDEMPPASLTNTAPPSVPDALALSHRRLSDLGQDLSQAHYDLGSQLLVKANQTLTQLDWSVLGLLALLFLLGLALAALVYRDMILPLRVKLVESQMLAERHEKLASLGLLAAGVAHEIRNPLTAIRAALFVQKRKAPAGSPESGNVEVVERETARLERIVNDFLRFARPAEPELTVMTADLLLLEARQFFAPQLERRNIRLECEPSEPLRVRVDTLQLKQVLINLIQNAADSIHGDGTVTLRARPDRRRLANGEIPVVVLEVSDTGAGIPPEVQKRLFDPFFTTKENGTGLGLSIAARIVQKHGGELQYQTQVNCGTTFGIILPRVME